jgi:hypothetical protein
MPDHRYSVLSFQSDTTGLTVDTNNTSTTWSTGVGIGTDAAKAIRILGKAALRGSSAIIIQARLQRLKSQFPHQDNCSSANLPAAYRDVLELSRYVTSFSSILSQLNILARCDYYSAQIRKKALRMLLRQIHSGHTHHLLYYLREWPSEEIGLFLREVMLCMPSRLTGSVQCFQE